MERILVVDDSPMILSAITKLLEEQFAVYTATSGENCLDQIIACQPDLILLDVNMPGMNGYETCVKIKSLEYTEHMPVMFISGCCSLEEKMRGYEVGGDDYITKPFEGKEVTAKIVKALKHKEDKVHLGMLASEATNVAMNAMSESSSLGVCLRFMEQSCRVANIGELIDEFFKAVSTFGLSTSLQVRVDGEVISREWDSEHRELEAALLSKLSDSGRYLAMGSRSVMNFPTASLLIKNMPVDNEERMGVIRDEVMILLQAADARISALENQIKLEKTQRYLSELNDKIKVMLKSIETDFVMTAGLGGKVMEELNDEIELVVQEGNFEEHVETKLIELGQTGIQKNQIVFSRALRLDSRFAKILAEMESK
ncbi:MAG: hypothetical protein COB04_06390 [Gammaproteobacteria bacterium]|nr:MAG: hypothetical protein COB04_06390 [Gammaproteobacteria bacterium]